MLSTTFLEDKSISLLNRAPVEAAGDVLSPATDERVLVKGRALEAIHLELTNFSALDRNRDMINARSKYR